MLSSKFLSKMCQVILTISCEAANRKKSCLDLPSSKKPFTSGMIAEYFNKAISSLILLFIRTPPATHYTGAGKKAKVKLCGTP